jgi:hypothetical protein
MEKSIKRRYELTPEELRLAVWHYLKDQLDEPMPARVEDLHTLDSRDENIMTALVVVWNETIKAKP